VSSSPPELTAEDGRPLAIVGSYQTRTDAYDRSLVVAAMEIPHWVLRRDGQFVLCVEPAHAALVTDELRRFEAEAQDRAANPAAASLPARYSTISLYVCVWIMSSLYAIQIMGPRWWLDRGTASSQAIMRGQWWQAATALTLHADLGHLGANLAAGLIYAAFLLPVMGAGWTWLFIVLAGTAGNWLNAWGYRHTPHLSIGASTAVFAALGILVAAQCTLRALAVRQVRAREFLLPIGAGLGLLAYLGGAGDQQTDYTAHFFGLVAGVPFGVLAVSLRLGPRTPPLLQAALAWTAVVFLALCWRLAAP
jgi:membrane associated rhomboid family serine protease